MEQMEVLLNVPTVSKSTVSSTQKYANSEDQKDFANIYEKNINDSESKAKASVSSKTESKTEEVKKETTTTSVKEESERLEKQGEVNAAWQTMIIAPIQSQSEEVPQETIGITGEQAVIDTVQSTENVTKEAEQTMKPQLQTASTEMSTDGSKEAKKTELPENQSESIPVETIQEEKATTNSIVNAKVAETSSEETKVVDIPSNTIVVETVQQSDKTAPITNLENKQAVASEVTNNSVANETVQDLPKVSIQESVLTQIENSLGKVVKPGNNEIRLQLEPENLGVLNIRIIAGKEGTQVVFKADSQQSSMVIANQTETLKTMLTDIGIKVDQIVVNDFSFSQQNFKNQQGSEQQSGNKFSNRFSPLVENVETYNNAYEAPQTIVGLNYLI
ncbi:MAG: flagellar hook-length control protein FliK [Anaerolineaceae bacterium]|nr:flagellar hook-length control protein FliK [Anaerolineaceae bacterium]